MHGLAVCDPRHLLAAPQQLVILSAANCVRGWTFFGKAAGLGKTKDFTRLSTVTLICIAVSQKTREDNIRNVANRFRDRHFSCLGFEWFIPIQFCF